MKEGVMDDESGESSHYHTEDFMDIYG